MEANMQILCTAARNMLFCLGTTVIYLRVLRSVCAMWMVHVEVRTANPFPHKISFFIHIFLSKSSLWYYWQSWGGTQWGVFLSTCAAFLQPQRWWLRVSPNEHMWTYGPTRCHSAGDIIKTAPGAKARRRLSISFLSFLYSTEILEVKGKPRLPVRSSILCDLVSVTQPFVKFLEIPYSGQ